MDVSNTADHDMLVRRRGTGLAGCFAGLFALIGFAIPVVVNNLVIWLCERTTGHGPSLFLPEWANWTWMVVTYTTAVLLGFALGTAADRRIARIMEERRSRRAVAGSNSQ
jgi:hypothetical protein